jgi:hypothetical protein
MKKIVILLTTALVVMGAQVAHAGTWTIKNNTSIAIKTLLYTVPGKKTNNYPTVSQPGKTVTAKLSCVSFYEVGLTANPQNPDEQFRATFNAAPGLKAFNNDSCGNHTLTYSYAPNGKIDITIE